MDPFMMKVCIRFMDVGNNPTPRPLPHLYRVTSAHFYPRSSLPFDCFVYHFVRCSLSVITRS